MMAASAAVTISFTINSVNKDTLTHILCVWYMSS